MATAGAEKIKTKRKRVVLSIKDKLEILDLLDQSVLIQLFVKSMVLVKALLEILKRTVRKSLILRRTWWKWV